MPLDLRKEAAGSGCTLTMLSAWTHEGHDVALVRYEKKDADPPYADVHLVCECDFTRVDVVKDGKVIGETHPKDPHLCRAKKAVRARVMDEAKERYAPRPKDGLKEAVLDIHAKVRAGEYFGQAYAGMIYAQEVAEILCTDTATVLDAIDALFAEEKLDMNGRILVEHVKRFRFPKEIQALFIAMVEEPLGWPNGEAGDCFLATIEGAIHEHTPYKSGAGAFWEHNYPHVDAELLARFARYFLRIAHARASRDPKALASLGDPSQLAKDLSVLAAQFDALKTPPKDPPPKRRDRRGKRKKTR